MFSGVKSGFSETCDEGLPGSINTLKLTRYVVWYNDVDQRSEIL